MAESLFQGSFFLNNRAFFRATFSLRSVSTLLPRDSCSLVIIGSGPQPDRFTIKTKR